MFSPTEDTGLNAQDVQYIRHPSDLPEVLEHKPPQGKMEVASSNIPTQLNASPQRRNPFNLSPLLFGALVSLITALVVGTAIGGGLGATLNDSEDCGIPSDTTPLSSIRISSSKTQTSTSTPTSPTSAASMSTDYAPPEPSRVESLDVNCPNLDGTIMKDEGRHPYKISCQRQYGGDSADMLSALAAYSLQDCINACFLYNACQGGQFCTAISWCSAMASCAADNGGANCWLYNTSSLAAINENFTAGALLG